MTITRRKAGIIKIGKVCIGGNYPVAIQSMAKTKTSDVGEVIRQVKALDQAGCQIVRLAIKDLQDARAIREIKPKVKLPLVADIHFNWRFAIEAIENGADKIRLNPGNIYKKNEVKEIAQAAKGAHIPIRVGVNSGSLSGARGQGPGARGIAEGMVKSALNYIKILEGFGFYNIVISLKASSILDTIEAYRKIAKLCDYPLHLGVTATGLPREGAIKSSIAIGALLLEGIGDTIRISLTAKPQEEVKVAKDILAALNLRHFGPEVISCPTCGRCEVDLVKIVKELENALASYPVSQLSCLTGKPANRQTGKPLTVAVMGCVVNGPGEAKEADIGVAFGGKNGLLFKKGRPIKKISVLKCADALIKEMER